MFQNVDPVVLFRMAERLTLTVVVIVVALVVLIGFWRTVQTINLKEGGSLGIVGSFVFSTPVFALLVVVGYAYVSLSHPIEFQGGPPAAASDAAGGEQMAAASGQARFLGAAGTIPEDEMPHARAVAQNRVRSVNCIASAAPSARVEDDLVEIKLVLMRPVWNAAWGEFSAFADWARGTSTGAPDAAAKAFYEERHVFC